MKLLLLRHGIVEENKEGRYIGREDVPLCIEGESALRQQEYPQVTAVFSSPLARCLQTAEIAYPGISVIVMEELQERDFGRFSGLSHGEITALPGYEDWGMEPGRMPFPGGEEESAFLDRCYRGFERITELTAKGAPAAAVTHGGVIMAVMNRLFPGEGFFNWQCGNGEGYLLTRGVGGLFHWGHWKGEGR